MAVRLGIGLPGPFVMTVGGRRRRRGSSATFWALFLVLLAGYLAFRYWYVGVPVLLAIATVSLVRREQHRSRR